MYCFVIGSHSRELLQEGIVLLCGASVVNCCRKEQFCDIVLVLRTVAGRYCFVILILCGQHLHEGIVL